MHLELRVIMDSFLFFYIQPSNLTSNNDEDNGFVSSVCFFFIKTLVFIGVDLFLGLQNQYHAVFITIAL